MKVWIIAGLQRLKCLGGSKVGGPGEGVTFRTFFVALFLSLLEAEGAKIQVSFGLCASITSFKIVFVLKFKLDS